jgi:6-phosphogluconolactonase (cycloisomerase 2 family)
MRPQLPCLAAGLLGLLLIPCPSLLARELSIEAYVQPALPAAGRPALRFVETLRQDSGIDGLGEPREVALSPDGRHLYATGDHLPGQPGRGAVVVFARDLTNGRLSLVEAQRDSIGPVAGLDSARGIAVSPDGAHVYVVANGVAVFARNVTTGELTFVEHEVEDGPRDGLMGAANLAISPDGRQVYVTGAAALSVVVYGRDPGSGRLTFLETLTDGVDGVVGLLGAWDVVVSPDGAFVYVTGSSVQSVVVFARDRESGRLTFVERVHNGMGGVQGLVRAWGIAMSPDGSHLYVAGRDQGSLVVFARDRTTGRLSYLERQRNGVTGVVGLSQPWAVAVSPDGSRVVASGRNDGAVAIFGRNPATGKLHFQQVLDDGTGGVDGLQGAEGVGFDPLGAHLYVAGNLDNALAVFTTAPRGQRLGVEGPTEGVVGQTLRYVASAADCTPTADWTWEVAGGVAAGGGNVRSITWSSAGEKTIVVRNDGCRRAIATRTVAVRDGVLQTLRVSRRGTGASLGRVRSSPAGIDCGGSGPCAGRFPTGTEVHLSATPPVGGTVTWGPACRAAHFVLDADRVCTVAFGRVPLDFVGALLAGAALAGAGGVTGLDDNTSIALSPDGVHAYVARRYGSQVAVLGRDGATGALRLLASEDGLEGGIAVVASSPDGAQVYGLGYATLGVFARDAASGRLERIEVLREGVDGVVGINGGEDVVASPDGAYVYVTGGSDNALAVFARDAASGRLTFVEALRNGIDGVTGLQDPTGIAVALDSVHVYVTGGYVFGAAASSLAVFARDPATGRLAFVQALWSGDGSSAVSFSGRVAVSPDGRQVYVVEDGEDSLTTYARDPATGRLILVEAEHDGVDGVDGLGVPDGLAISPDGSRVYVTARYDSSLAVFGRNAASGRLTFMGLARDAIGGVDGLAGAAALAVSNDGRHVYAAGSEGLAVFAATGP